MVNLTALQLHGEFSDTIGKEFLFPRLKSLSFSGTDLFHGFPLQNLKALRCDEFYPEDLDNVEKFTNYLDLKLPSVSKVDGLKPFSIDDKVKSLDLCLRLDELKGSFKDREFLKVSLRGSGFRGLLPLPHVQSIELCSCNCVDIFPIAHVPYMKISSCKQITDFSCLGSQHYLWVDNCPGLTENTIEENFGTISWLKISRAPKITRLQNLRDNRYLAIIHCTALSELLLEGMDYI
jgi:hypothetical protein